MAQLFSRYESGVQLTAAPMVGSVAGVSGLNPIVDRLNSISTDDNLITGSIISGTNTILNVNSSNFGKELIGSGFIKIGSDALLQELAVFKFATNQIGSIDILSLELNVLNNFAGQTGSIQVQYINIEDDIKTTIRNVSTGSGLDGTVNLTGHGNVAGAYTLAENTNHNGNLVSSFTQGGLGGTLNNAGSLIILGTGNRTSPRLSLNYRLWRSKL